MNNIKWIFKGIIIALASGVFAWFFNDGLNWILQSFGLATFPTNPLTKVLSFFSIFLFMTGADLMVNIRAETNNYKKEISDSISTSLITNAGMAIDNSLLRVIWPGLDVNPKSLLRIIAITRSLIYPLTKISGRLLDAYSVVIERDIHAYAENIQKLGSDGFSVDIADHIETSKRLARDANSYVQIQRKTFLVPDEWTSEWRFFVDWMSQHSIPSKYIVLIDEETLIKNKAKLESMNKFLTQRRWSFLYCNLDHVKDSLGGKLPTEDNVEVFDNEILKIQGLPKGVYQGGIKLNMRFLELAKNDDFRRFLQTISNFSQEYSLSLYKTK